MQIKTIKPVDWDGALRLVDQRQLPERELWVTCRTVEEAAESIENMTVRGAPAIGVTAAYAMALAVKNGDNIDGAYKRLAATRPTAVNLFWALDQCKELHSENESFDAMLSLARKIHEDDIAGNLLMGQTGANHVKNGMSILTHCNAGALATGGIGTALGVIFVAHAQGKNIHVYVDETRPRLQGARLTTWELSKMGVPYTLICDNMAASLMARGKIQMCVTGADRIAANGDTANKIGTYSVAVNAHHHKIPFYVAAPKTTFDLKIIDGDQIPIEERSTREVSDWGSESTCARGSQIFNPGFDVTPAKLIKAIFTERGEISPVTAENVKKILA